MSRGRFVLAAALVASALRLAQAAPAGPTPPDLSVKGLVSAATAYVARYQQDFAFLIADESYTQTRLRASKPIESRTLLSEFFLAFLPADNEWVAVRDVMEVDGAPVTHRDDLRTLLSGKSEFRGLIAQVVERNARYNIGDVVRNFNEPTLPLLLLDAKRVGDVKFERRTVAKEGDLTLVTMSFAERGRPTLVRFKEGPSVPATGEFVMEAGTGAVRRTRFEFDRPGLKVRLTTDYARDARLGLWLPVLFTERYETEATQEMVLCQATYANYRRFEVNARIR